MINLLAEIKENPVTGGVNIDIKVHTEGATELELETLEMFKEAIISAGGNPVEHN